VRIFVTGGTGFIGKHLLGLLNHHDVLCLSHQESLADENRSIRFIQGDLSIPASYFGELERFKPECCIHLAWGGLPNYSFSYCNKNLMDSSCLFEKLGQLGCDTIFSGGSCWEYGETSGLVQENHPCQSKLSLFAAHKTALQLIGQSFCDAAGSRFVWGRMFFVYGAGQRSSSLIPSCYHSFKSGASPVIRNSLAVNDFIHVTDVASAICKLIESEHATGIYNIGSGQAASVGEVANLVAAEMGLAPVYNRMSLSTDGVWADTSKMQALGWNSRLSLQEGISQTISMMEIDS